MAMKLGLVVGTLAVVLAGCAGGAGGGSPAHTAGGWGGENDVGGQASPAQPSPAGAPAPGDFKSADAPPPPPTTTATGESAQIESAPSGGSHWQTPAPEPRERPGLGTEWGEQRESHIREVSFFRADPDRPFATAELFYNDRRGIEALAAWHGGTPSFHEVPSVNGAITVSLRDAWGEPLDAMHVGDRTYVAGTQGERYAIVIANHSARRFEAVATVDGLDVINGQSGSFSNRGYVLMPHASLEIDGFRQSEDVVAAFRFAKVRDSYAAQRGEARNVGVIGIAFFGERGDDWNEGELRTRDTASPFPTEGRFAPAPR
ncbi:MAG TPA: hypothetical protein VGG39_27320 [Polyangiaceae bacterium]|jgi:hypothetical protein